MDLTPWEKVKLARMPIRPTGLDYIDLIFNGFQELHGDRQYGEDRAIVGGIAFLGDTPVTVIGQWQEVHACQGEHPFGELVHEAARFDFWK